MPKIYITYAVTPRKELIISSYHEKVQSKSNAAALVRKDGLKLKDLQEIEGEFPKASQDAIQSKLLELLSTLDGRLESEFEKVTYRGDLNLCTSDKSPTDCLFDGTLNRFFSGKEVYLILESANKEYVEDGIALADKNGLTGATLQTKTGVSEKLTKTYPSSGVQNKGVPSPDADALAQDTVKIKDPGALSEVLVKVGVFTNKETTSEASNPEALVQENTQKTNKITG
ncbi:hypothetical protein ACTAZI_15985 [Legionella bozemanae]|uniref:hypothetical protein n=1 Tax=Legionella bozemanae TaxID=447 RepID=UPI00399CFB25